MTKKIWIGMSAMMVMAACAAAGPQPADVSGAEVDQALAVAGDGATSVGDPTGAALAVDPRLNLCAFNGDEPTACCFRDADVVCCVHLPDQTWTCSPNGGGPIIISP